MIQSHPNLGLVNRFFQAYATNDQESIKEILSPNIRWIIPGKHPLSGVKVGVDEVMAYFSQLGKAAFQASPIVMGVNDQYVIDCHENWTTGSEIPTFKGMSCLLWKIKEGKIIEVYNFPEDQHKVDEFFQAVYN
ncbi:hypothetical protein GCM10028818_12480 [Spirosoma horti]